MTLISHTVAATCIMVTVEELERRGLSATALLAEYGWRRSGVTAPLKRLKRDAAIAFIQQAAARAGDPALHMVASANATLGRYHVADYYTLFAPTLGAGYSRTLRHTHIFDSALATQLTSTPEGMCIALSNPQGERVHTIEAELILAAFAARTQIVCGPQFAPAQIRFARALPVPAGVVSDIVNGPVADACGGLDTLIIPHATWAAPSLFANPTMHEILDRLAVQTSKHSAAAKGFLRRVESALTQGAWQVLSLKAVAGVMRLSERTLQRRMTELGIGFRTFANRTRHRLATRYLRDPLLNVTEIAGRLGYADSSAFGRAFRTVTGHSPSKFRRLSEAEQAAIEGSLSLDHMTGEEPR